jgi:DNA-binding GntR family transcriptional regulator
MAPPLPPGPAPSEVAYDAGMSPRKGGGSSRQAVLASLRRQILGLELAPGAALSEKDLAAQLGVSRTPVRESLILLSEEGLVQVYPKLGTFVCRIDTARVADAQFLCEAVELSALEDLPPGPAPELVSALQQNLAEQRVAGLGREEFLRLDEQFHQNLLNLSGHATAWAALAPAKGYLDRARRNGFQNCCPLVGQHSELLEALLAGAVEAARSLLRRHLRAALEDVERALRRSPEFFTPESCAAQLTAGRSVSTGPSASAGRPPCT